MLMMDLPLFSHVNDGSPTPLIIIKDLPLPRVNDGSSPQPMLMMDLSSPMLMMDPPC